MEKLTPEQVERLKNVTLKISAIFEEEKVDLADVQKILTSLQMNHTEILVGIINEQKNEPSK